VAVFTRKDSPWFWLWLEPSGDLPGEKERTGIRADAPTPQQHKDNYKLAEQLYHVKMSARARGVIAPDAKPSRTFSGTGRAWFIAHATASRRRGKEREGAIDSETSRGVRPLRRSAKMTRTLVTERWITPRLTTPTVIASGKRTAPADRFRPGLAPSTARSPSSKRSCSRASQTTWKTSPLYGMPLLKTGTPKRRILTPEEEAGFCESWNPTIARSS
jgi:hypothetical protein